MNIQWGFQQRGYGLIELMIAMTLGFLIVGGAMQIYLASKSSFRVQESLGRIQENARFAVEQISRDIRLVGYGGSNYQSWSVKETGITAGQLGAITGECFSAPFRWAAPMITSANIPPLIFGENDTVGNFAGCVEDYALGDILSLHFSAPTAIADADLVNGRIYVRSSLQQGTVFRCQMSGNCVPADGPIAGTIVENYAVYSAVYYIRNYSEVKGDGVNTLVRAVLAANGEVSLEPVVENVEHLQFQYGVDFDDNGVVDRYVNANEIGSYTNSSNMLVWRNVRTVRMWLLLRGGEEPNRQVSVSSYDLGDISNFSIDPKYRYEVFVTTAMIRNQGV